MFTNDLYSSDDALMHGCSGHFLKIRSTPFPTRHKNWHPTCGVCWRRVSAPWTAFDVTKPRAARWATKPCTTRDIERMN